MYEKDSTVIFLFPGCQQVIADFVLVSKIDGFLLYVHNALM